ncbi:probable prolyl 4-hydroxylase 9 [Eucalyptus grandis]|uniref:probable prolyl 4-hydroxylase 9 n=1 Tax=Eucalyptus grandis TaxID=71139 RepID=UPI00192E7AE3|nr:probable prolyl 4-hydroxylase 9 [Eucalyptus grandis]
MDDSILQVGNNTKCDVVGVDNVRIEMQVGIVKILTGVRHILELKNNLISLSALDLVGSGMFISASKDKTGTLDIIEEKFARVTMIPREHGEAFDVLPYEIGQKYSSHCDAFDPAQYGPQKSQRVATFLLYLSDVEEGGETMFPFENGMNMDGTYDFKKCVGLKVKPRQGDGLLFYSLLPNGTIDPTSIHGSCPVIKGEKWVAPKWIRDQVQDD